MIDMSELGALFVHAADTLVSDFDLVEFLHTITESVARVGDVDAVGLMLADHDGALRYMASSNHDGRLLELLQLAIGQGPCPDAYASQAPVAAEDLAAATDRWPEFCERATAAGYASAHAFPLLIKGQAVGAMGLFGTTRTRLDDQDGALVQALADLATIGVLRDQTATRHDELLAQLQGALHSRIVIEQAKGAIGATARVSVADAFHLLRAYARRHGLGLTEVATQVLDSPRATAHWWLERPDAT